MLMSHADGGKIATRKCKQKQIISTSHKHIQLCITHAPRKALLNHVAIQRAIDYGESFGRVYLMAKEQYHHLLHSDFHCARFIYYSTAMYHVNQAR
jgi:hypothetical protein